MDWWSCNRKADKPSCEYDFLVLMACNLLCVKVELLEISCKRKVSIYKSLNKSMENRWKFLERYLSIGANCRQVSKGTFLGWWCFGCQRSFLRKSDIDWSWNWESSILPWHSLAFQNGSTSFECSLIRCSTYHSNLSKVWKFKTQSDFVQNECKWERKKYYLYK